MKKGCRYGTHRVLSPAGTLPQPAQRLDNTMEVYDNEVLIDVSTLNVDSASYTQIKQACGKDAEKMKQMILSIVEERGKLQNPVTGSGGMLIGTVKKIGENFPKNKLKVGDKIATLVSLSLTPLKIKAIKKLVPESDQVDVEAEAILFESGLFATLPDDIPEKLALAALDVAGAPAQVDRLVTEGDIVCIIGGGGKSGILCCYQAMQNSGPSGKVIVVEFSKENAKRIADLNLATDIIVADATNVMDVYNKVMEVTGGRGCDVTVNNVNVPSTEMTSILITKGQGHVYFFSMATSFTKAALGAEGVGKDINLIVGNGYAKGHANLTLNIIRESKEIRELFEKLYV
ncbi:MAG: L-erythro-3,5-diaminohexanoate dehydrogenase [Bacteroidetes bacterium HGW-Bacteroidetes-6]|jgi:L-erythro-3,5-diaminohexanoate dehydrogenase|nr:L-erythro-3,5-diaminohexanoate dehydrogenase [Bacteroidales bacterium]MDP3397734.1 L-erythro-3,5-diaminohexanoate dehydrogenase [Bacteroidales bacterium]PKO96574.1 MAG: L-erythro-3,5-diaminohexanoate dehydrogenase [Bacteroidetes bacterium HGW-Bacteroidetes-7]PKP04890.1 MAG: L-erythro-3,5-diaminohexanoate dehydrogenase [Bacteroidetes bacterium HGW-Bacteroidetes-6]